MKQHRNKKSGEPPLERDLMHCCVRLLGIVAASRLQQARNGRLSGIRAGIHQFGG